MSFFEPGRSLAEIIDAVFFSEGGFLVSEYDRLFTSLFADNKNYRKIVEYLSSLRYGATRPQISEKTGITEGGTLSDMLKALVKSDLVTTYLCEMKFARDEFLIDKDYDAKLRAKIEALTQATKNKKNIQTTIVTTYGLKTNMYSGKVQRVISMDDLSGKV